MVFSIKVERQTQEGPYPLLYAEEFSERQGLLEVPGLFNGGREYVWPVYLIAPVRTDSFEHFWKDFLLPGFFNLAIKTNNLACDIFFQMFAIAMDLISLPIRLVTVIPRAIYNAMYSKESHPFYRYLIERGVSEEDLKDEKLCLTICDVEEYRRVGEAQITRYQTASISPFHFVDFFDPDGYDTYHIQSMT